MNKDSKKYKIYKYLYNNIISQKYNIGDILPSENELADMFSVSRMTAREAISLIINNGFAKREHGKGSFVISTSPDKKEIILMLPGIVNPGADDYFYFLNNHSKLLAAIQDNARKLGYSIKIVLSDFKKSAEKDNLIEMIKKRPDALIVNCIGDESTEHLLKTLKDLGVFVVMYDTYKEDLCNGFVVSDNYGGTMNLLNENYQENIIELWTYNRSISSISDRNKAYIDFAKKHNFYHKELIHKIDFLSDTDMQKVTKEYILSNNIDFEKSNMVFFATSALFTGYVEALKELNIKPDKKYICVDEAPNGEEYNLKYLQQDWTAIGEKSIEMIDQYFKEDKNLNTKIFVDTKIKN